MATKLTNAHFNADLALARKGNLTNAQVNALVEKWGPRGGAFYAFFK